MLTTSRSEMGGFLRRLRKFELIGLVLLIACVTFNFLTSSILAQSATGSFNPQAQLQVGSRIIIRSIYGIGTVRPRYTNNSGQPTYHWNGTMQNLPTYNASITVDAQITGDTDNGGVQFVVQGGVMMVDNSTIAITAGQGEVSAVDRILIQGTAASETVQSINWHMEGLAALYDGAVIAEMSGNVPVTINGVQTSLIITYLTTIS